MGRGSGISRRKKKRCEENEREKYEETTMERENKDQWKQKWDRVRWKIEWKEGGLDDSLGIMQETEVWPYWQMIYAQNRIYLRFSDPKNHQILARKPDTILINKKKRTCLLVYFPVPVDHQMKIKESEKIDKYLDLAWELKRKFVQYEGDSDTNGALGTVPQNFDCLFG